MVDNIVPVAHIMYDIGKLNITLQGSSWNILEFFGNGFTLFCKFCFHIFYLLESLRLDYNLRSSDCFCMP